MTPDTIIFAMHGDEENQMIGLAKQFIKFHSLTADDVKMVRVDGGVWIVNKRVLKLKSGFIEFLGGISNEYAI